MTMGFQRREPKHLLDTTADQNIGNGVIVQPQLTGPTTIPQTNPDRILTLSGPSGTGQTTSIVLTAARIVGSHNPNPGYPGPITGVIEFGNGGQFTRVEVDIPIGPFVGYTNQAAPATEPQDGGVIVTVPTGVLRIYARYDNALIQPQINTAGLSLAQQNGMPFVGPGGPVNLQVSGNPYIIPAEPVRVKAMAAYYARRGSKAYRTQYLYVGDQSTGIYIPLPPGTSGGFCIPPFAQTLKVLREPLATSFTLTLYDNINHILDQIAVTAGTAPTIPLIGTETIVTITNTGGIVRLLAFCYEIGI